LLLLLLLLLLCLFLLLLLLLLCPISLLARVCDRLLSIFPWR